MNELGLNPATLAGWFTTTAFATHDFVQVPASQNAQWVAGLAVPLRRCYITDNALAARAAAANVTRSDIVRALIPDPGSVMAGDFGEVLALLYTAGTEHPAVLISPKRWRFKQQRTHAAPCTDVVSFVLPAWPIPTDADEIICSEVKTKSTASAWQPIPAAIEGCKKDRKSRLAKTLVWLREKALTAGDVSVGINQLDRFLEPTSLPPATKRFRAVAVVCDSVAANVLATVPNRASTDFTLIVMTVPQLQTLYESVFQDVVATADNP